MRTPCAAIALLLSAHAALADARVDFWDRIAALPADKSLAAYEALECSLEAAAAIASRDQITPAALMAETAAKEAASQCGGTALATAVGNDEAAKLAEMIHSASVERALQVRRGEPVMRCAVEWRGCSMR